MPKRFPFLLKEITYSFVAEKMLPTQEAYDV